MEDLTGHSESSRDEFLNDSPPSALQATASVDETETQGAAGFVASSEETLEVGEGEENDDIACTSTNVGERSSSSVEVASGDLKSSEQGEAESQDSPTSGQSAGELELLNKTTPAEVENDKNNEEDKTQRHLLATENSGSTVEVSPTTEPSKDASVSKGSDSSTRIDITTNVLYSGFEVPGDEPLEIAAGTGSEAEKENAESRTAQEQQALESLYHIKWIKWKGINTPIITQNENGPCPLLAIVNVLLLQRRINLPSQQTFITSGQLMEYIGDCILEESPKRLSEGAQLNYEQNMHDAIAIMNKLQTGLDVNVKFTGVADFEFTPECIVFDLLSIGLYHGWLIDPQNAETVSAVGGLGYNQLVEKIIASKQDGAESQLVSEGLIGEAFLEQTASQLTYHGLCELNSQLKDDQLCVFFRNNHFCTMLKLKDELFQLVTDQGFLTEDRVIWESLTNVEGDGFFVDAEFRSLPVVNSEPQPAPVPPSQQLSQEDQDYLIALSLVEEERSPGEAQTHPGGPAQTQPLSTQVPTQANQELSDLQLAMQLQEEERREQQQRQQQQQLQRTQSRPQPPRGSPSRSNIPLQSQQQSSNSNQQRGESVIEKCVIL